MTCSLEQRRTRIQPNHPRFSVSRQCTLLGLARSSFYYVPLGESAENLRYLRLLDQEYTRHPFYGVRRMSAWLQEQGYGVGPKRVRRLLRTMGLMAVYPKPRLSLNGLEHRRFPYLLGELEIGRPNQVWSADITYGRLRAGFVYLVAVLDWFSRYVLSWELSKSREEGFCVAALERALAQDQPEIFNTDQGVQFTSQRFQSPLLAAGAQISMDGRGRVFDNIFVERLWRSVKYEEVYLKDYRDVPEARQNLGEYFGFYNTERLHQALGYRTPAYVHQGGP
jgi:putative transposase